MADSHLDDRFDPRELHPFKSAHVDFPYEEVFDRLDGCTCEDGRAESVEAIRRVLALITRSDPNKKRNDDPLLRLRMAGLRAYGLQYVIDPNAVSGSSSHKLRAHLHCYRTELMRTINDMKRILGLKPRIK